MLTAPATREDVLEAIAASPSSPPNVAGLLLWEPTLGTLPLHCEFGYVATSVDLGMPTAREVSWTRPLRNGTYDTSRYTGARAITIPVVLDGNVAMVESLLSRVRAFMDPARRPFLLFTPEGATQRRIQVRGVDAPAVFSRPKSMEVVLQFVSVDSGLIVDAAQTCRTIRPGAGAAVGGRSYPWTPPRDYPDATVPSGAYVIHNYGSAPAPWSARIYGEISDPVLTVNGDDVAFTRGVGLDLAAGNYVLVDAESRTVVADNGESRYDRWQFTDGWPILQPGVNYVSLTGATVGATASAEFCWRSAWY